ncbi:MAG: zf-HC2 domain-containing protein [Gemmatimonadaceae bacterium]|nr:zf-HC2 domain-containing protein [Gemmatimonadaceae bacterium]
MSAPTLDTEVAGLRCRDVLDALSAYLDGELDANRVQALNAHLADCANCARFGGQMGTFLTKLRAGVPLPSVDTSMLQRVLKTVGQRE